jgi:hypothetical protein
MFDFFYQARREANPDEPIYITMCFVMQYSGTDRDEVELLFDTYMKVKQDYDKEEKKEMVDYLYKLAKEV